ncbi:SMP-30/gluconolactonase/LRE family protein [Nannocystis radixulma]|uniref:SMP-30/Gluconolactonase/LRE-like region domain-containing protein n=1 Tax=Nannocystis radixulma TaxID=2995305 RepID=A0ABT5BMK8_9BACT|nr:hypothetical protein [Nannocystis radixulma]MDC0675405.1 hypothetical protein [Nannocystis radixulma]
MLFDRRSTPLAWPASLLLVLALACTGGGGSTTETSGQDPSTSTSETGTMGQVSSTSTGEASSTATTDEPPTGTSGPTTDATSSSGGPTTGSTTAETTDTTTGSEGPITVEGLKQPESILYDATADAYLISNINGQPTGVDDNGFIVRVQPDGSVEDEPFIDGAAADVTLDAPKGMAIVGDSLYVTDITVVRKFDRVSGAHLVDIPIEGAMFLNDLSADAAGDVYVSDMGAQTIHVITPDDQLSLVLSSPDLAGPNGLFADDDGVHVVTNSAAKLLYVPREMPAVMELVDLPDGALDGLERDPEGGWLVSSWEGTALYRVSADLAAVDVAIAGLSSPADIGFDPVRSRVLVPLMFEDRAVFHDLP